MVGGYSFSDAILYFLTVPFIASITNLQISSNLSEDIRSGDLSNYLLKPYNFWLKTFCAMVANKIIQLAVAIPVYGGILTFFVLRAGVTLSLLNILIGLSIALLALLMHFMLDLGITWLAFWTQDIWAFFHVKRILF